VSGAPRYLAEHEVHIWWVGLDPPAAVVEALRGCLAADELARAGRLRAPGAAARFVVARGALRRILGAYLDCPPGDVAFSYSASGKPALAGGTPRGARALRFSLSHSGSVAAYALARGRDVGIDIEEIRPGGAEVEIASRYFSPGEADAVAAATGAERDRLFYRCWTRREARLKAEGLGLLSSGPSCPGRASSAAGPAGRWRALDLDAPPGYAGALVVEGGGVCLVAGCWRL
jgi:4'-phosphopantetheinyl transferase